MTRVRTLCLTPAKLCADENGKRLTGTEWTMMLAATPLLKASTCTRPIARTPSRCAVLRGLDLEVHEGEFLSIVGASGSGKSTLLHLLGTLDQPDRGRRSISTASASINVPAAQRDELRNRTFGFIFQFYHLLPELTRWKTC